MTRNSGSEISQDVEALKITSFSNGQQACRGQFAVGAAIAEADLDWLDVPRANRYGRRFVCATARPYGALVRRYCWWARHLPDPGK